MNTITTYIAEVDGPFANEMHELVTEGGADEKRAWFALNFAINNTARKYSPMTPETAAYLMNEYVGSTKIRNYAHLISMLEMNSNITTNDAMFLRSDFILVDEVVCTCDVCDAR